MTKPSEPILGFFSAKGYEIQSLILLRSLREFGGEMAHLPVWMLEPESHAMDGPALDVMRALNIEIIPFAVEEALYKFPFAAKAAAAAKAEAQAEAEGKILAWHDRTGMIRQAPVAFNLPTGKALGFRPTDVTNIGVPADEPLSPFWEEICQHFDIAPESLGPITTIINQETIHLYVNAGLLVVRPEFGILRKWAKNLSDAFRLEKFQKFYRENRLYGIFMHQAALTAAVVQTTTPKERLILPKNYLFSVDNFFDYPADLRLETLDEIITGRFHEFFNLENWEDLITASESLVAWFKTQLKYGKYWQA